MKKSEIYKELQNIIISSESWLSCDEKLEILRELMEQEDLAKFDEDQEAKQNEDIQ